MKYIQLPEKPVRRLTFYLAAEEYVARYLDEDECFFMWQVNPTVIFGRNQLIASEVNLDYCRAHGINTFRRKSGGGCVYADMSNIMFSYITKSTSVQFTFDKYMRRVALMLNRLGVNAVASGRNDVMIDGRKVSGNAFYHLPEKSIVHGTMLYDTDIEAMVHAISPSDEKIISKGVQSVRQHVTNLREHIDLDIEQFKAFVRNDMCDEPTIVVDERGIELIEEIEKEYLTHEFIYGNNPRCTISRKQRIEGVGEIEINLEVNGNVIRNVNILGDYFLVGDIDRQLIDKLGEWYRGCPSQVYTAAPIETAYGRVLLYGYIDEIREGKVCDLKTTSRYSFGKYEHYWQRYLYPYCLQRNNLMKPEAFVFDVIQWRELKGQPLDGVRYQEEYTYLHEVAEEKLRGICERFAEFLELHRSEITDRKIFGEEA